MNLSDPISKQTAPRIIGVDMSHWQGNIDFSKLAYHNIRFAIFKAGEIPTGSRTEFTDPRYARNIVEAPRNGIITGAYYFFHPAIGASQQARHFDAVMDKFGRPDLPPVIDVESTDNLSPVKVAAVLKAMIDALVARGYRLPVIYSRWGFLVNQVGEPYWLKEHFLWLAQYNTTLTVKPRDMSKVIIWQYTDKLRLAGIGVNLDGNYWLKSEAELLALVKKPTIVEPPVIEAPVEVVEPAPEPETVPEPEKPVEVTVESPVEVPVDVSPGETEEAPVVPSLDQPSEWESEYPLEEPEPEPQPAPAPAQPQPVAPDFWLQLVRFLRALLQTFGRSSD
jgi:lysozyme